MHEERLVQLPVFHCTLHSVLHACAKPLMVLCTPSFALDNCCIPPFLGRRCSRARLDFHETKHPGTDARGQNGSSRRDVCLTGGPWALTYISCHARCVESMESHAEDRPYHSVAGLFLVPVRRTYLHTQYAHPSSGLFSPVRGYLCKVFFFRVFTSHPM